MKITTLATATLAAAGILAAGDLGAQNVMGTWQGTLADGSASVRLVLQLSREDDGRLVAALFNVDRGFGAPQRSHAVSQHGRAITASFGSADLDATSRLATPL